MVRVWVNVRVRVRVSPNPNPKAAHDRVARRSAAQPGVERPRVVWLVRQLVTCWRPELGLGLGPGRSLGLGYSVYWLLPDASVSTNPVPRRRRPPLDPDPGFGSTMTRSEPSPTA